MAWAASPHLTRLSSDSARSEVGFTRRTTYLGQDYPQIRMVLNPRSSWTLTFVGWVLFTVSAVFFTAGALRDGNVTDVLASLSFLLACVLFMVPAILNRPRSD